MATAYSLYHKYRTAEGGGGPYQDIDTKHHAFLDWLDNSDGGGIVLEEEGGSLTDSEYSNIITKQDPAGMQAAEDTLRTTTGVIGGGTTAPAGEEGGAMIGSPGLDWEQASLQPAGQTIPTDYDEFYSFMPGQEGSLISQYGIDMDAAYDSYRESAKNKRDELLTGTSSAMSEMGLLSGTSGQILKSGEAMRNIGADIESASDIAANLSETYELGMDTAELTFESGIETSWNTYMSELDNERTQWSNQIMAALTAMGSNDMIVTAPTISELDELEGEELCECGWDPFSLSCIPCEGDDADEGGDIEGCTDPSYDNYNPDATVDNGSCWSEPEGWDEECDYSCPAGEEWQTTGWDGLTGCATGSCVIIEGGTNPNLGDECPPGECHICLPQGGQGPCVSLSGVGAAGCCES